MSSPPASAPSLHPAAITFALVSCAYALGLCPGLYWLDSGELAAAGFELGIAHAPGQPLALLLFRLFDFLPIGDVSLRAGLSQVLCGAGAAAVLSWIAGRVASRFLDSNRAAELMGLAAGLLYASSYAAAFQAIRPEVYALSALLVLGTIALCLRYSEEREPRHLALAGLLFGLGLTNHHYLTLLGAAPPALALLVPSLREARLRRGLMLAAIGTALALILYVYLPLRSARAPIFDWGHPTNLSSFFWVVSARSFQKSGGTGSSDDLTSLLGALLDQLTPVTVLLALGGLYLLARRARGLGIALVCMLAGPVLGRLFVSFDAGNPDAYGYLSTGVAALALLSIPLCAALIAALPRRAHTGLAAGLVALCLVRGLVAAPTLSLRRFDETRAVFAPLLEKVPPHALVVTSYYQTTFALAYLRVVEGARPDLGYVARHFLSHPGERASLLARDPQLAPLLEEKDVAPLALLESPRRLVLEYDLDLDPRLAQRAAVIPVPFGEGTELQTRRFAIWQGALLLHRLCVLGAPPRQLASVEAELRRRSGQTGEGVRFIDELMARCPTLSLQRAP